jgi:DNA-binding beta-propeller fold protein YncE
MKFCQRGIAAFLILILGACSSSHSPFTQRDLARGVPIVPGGRSDGSVLLPNQWSLRPVGRQIPLGDFPVNIALSPNGRFAAVLHSGNSDNEIFIVDLKSNSVGVVSRAIVEESFYGLAFSPEGTELYCSGAGDEVVHQFDFADGYLSDHRAIKLRDSKLRSVPSGLAMSRDGKTLFVANLFGHRLSYIDLESAESEPFTNAEKRPRRRRRAPIGSANTNAHFPETLFSTNALLMYATNTTNIARVSEDEAAITKRAEAALEDARSDLPYPYACVADDKRDRVYVSLWAQACVAVIDSKTREIVTRWATEEHPNEMVLSKSGKYLFVANANRNSVSVLDAETGKTVETLVATLLPDSPNGNTPNSLALSSDEKHLFVANANINTVAVFDVSNPGKSTSLGFIPVGWYPTSVRVTSDGKKLLVANGKGLISKSNRNGPAVGREAPASVREYIAHLMQGSLSIIDLPGRDKFDNQMKDWTKRAYSCLPTNAKTNATQAANLSTNTSDFRNQKSEANWENPVPRVLGEKSPIKYVFYVIKENRTYDQVLGDMPEGNGDPTITLFGEKVTPNHHALAREFVLLDNFYVESEVSADGHEWTMGAYATDWVEKIWPLSYGHNGHKKYIYPAEGNFPIATPAGGYLWDRAREAGVSYRSYGEFVANGKKLTDPCKTKVRALEGHFDPWYHSFDTDYLDVKRADRFMSELKRFEKEGDMPQLQIVRLGNDHTSGTASNKYTPTAALGDNDLALGRFVEAVSHSKFWPQTAIFVVEDDAQNGSDHVDAHRTIAFAISPYIKRNSVDSTMYSTSSMLRTMELILGLKPMSQFDAAAIPMFNSFTSKPDFTPYKLRPAQVDLAARNHPNAPGAKRSAKMDFSKEDMADDLALNEVIWESVKGENSVMPPPRRAAFVFNHPKDDDDND